MSDDSLIPWSPDLSQRWCPGCEPTLDPLTTILIEDWCATHRPSRAGLDDARVEQTPIPGSGDTDGDTQRRMAELLGVSRSQYVDQPSRMPSENCK